MSLERADQGTTNAPGKERRRHPRHETFWRATLRTANRVLDCYVIDVSTEGARVRVVTPTVTAPVKANEKVMLTVAGIARVFAVVAWARRNVIGVRIRDARTIADWRAAMGKHPPSAQGRRTRNKIPAEFAEKFAPTISPSPRVLGSFEIKS
jgi:PilZ domain